MQPDLEMIVEGTYVPAKAAADGYHTPDSAYLFEPKVSYIALPPQSYIDTTIISPSPGYKNGYADSYHSYAEGFDNIVDLMSRLGLTEEAARVMLNDPETFKTIDENYRRFDDPKPSYLADIPLDIYKTQESFEGPYKTQQGDVPPLTFKLKVEEDFAGMVKLFPDSSIVYEPYTSPMVDAMYKEMLEPEQENLFYKDLTGFLKE